MLCMGRGVARRRWEGIGWRGRKNGERGRRWRGQFCVSRGEFFVRRCLFAQNDIRVWSACKALTTRMNSSGSAAVFRSPQVAFKARLKFPDPSAPGRQTTLRRISTVDGDTTGTPGDAMILFLFGYGDITRQISANRRARGAQTRSQPATSHCHVTGRRWLDAGCRNYHTPLPLPPARGSPASARAAPGTTSALSPGPLGRGFAVPFLQVGLARVRKQDCSRPSTTLHDPPRAPAAPPSNAAQTREGRYEQCVLNSVQQARH